MGAMKIDNSPARGMRDLLPADVAVRDHVLESIAAVYRRFGYQRIETPALEDINRLSSGEGADNEKLVYQVLRRGLPRILIGYREIPLTMAAGSFVPSYV